MIIILLPLILLLDILMIPFIFLATFFEHYYITQLKKAIAKYEAGNVDTYDEVVRDIETTYINAKGIDPEGAQKLLDLIKATNIVKEDEVRDIIRDERRRRERRAREERERSRRRDRRRTGTPFINVSL